MTGSDLRPPARASGSSRSPMTWFLMTYIEPNADRAQMTTTAKTMATTPRFKKSPMGGLIKGPQFRFTSKDASSSDGRLGSPHLPCRSTSGRNPHHQNRLIAPQCGEDQRKNRWSKPTGSWLSVAVSTASHETPFTAGYRPDFHLAVALVVVCFRQHLASGNAFFQDCRIVQHFPHDLSFLGQLDFAVHVEKHMFLPMCFPSASR
jgi:hypothetical protein